GGPWGRPAARRTHLDDMSKALRRTTLSLMVLTALVAAFAAGGGANPGPDAPSSPLPGGSRDSARTGALSTLAGAYATGRGYFHCHCGRAAQLRASREREFSDPQPIASGRSLGQYGHRAGQGRLDAHREAGRRAYSHVRRPEGEQVRTDAELPR